MTRHQAGSASSVPDKLVLLMEWLAWLRGSYVHLFPSRVTKIGHDASATTVRGGSLRVEERVQIIRNLLTDLDHWIVTDPHLIPLRDDSDGHVPSASIIPSESGTTHVSETPKPVSVLKPPSPPTLDGVPFNIACKHSHVADTVNEPDTDELDWSVDLDANSSSQGPMVFDKQRGVWTNQLPTTSSRLLELGAASTNRVHEEEEDWTLEGPPFEPDHLRDQNQNQNQTPFTDPSNSVSPNTQLLSETEAQVFMVPDALMERWLQSQRHHHVCLPLTIQVQVQAPALSTWKGSQANRVPDPVWEEGAESAFCLQTSLWRQWQRSEHALMVMD